MQTTYILCGRKLCSIKIKIILKVYMQVTHSLASKNVDLFPSTIISATNKKDLHVIKIHAGNRNLSYNTLLRGLSSTNTGEHFQTTQRRPRNLPFPHVILHDVIYLGSGLGQKAPWLLQFVEHFAARAEFVPSRLSVTITLLDWRSVTS